MKRLLSILMTALSVVAAQAYAPRVYEVAHPSGTGTFAVTVVLPKGYDAAPDRRYPVRCFIPGSGASARDLYDPANREIADRTGSIYVHSDVGDAPFVREHVLPWVKTRYRVLADRCEMVDRLVLPPAPVEDATLHGDGVHDDTAAIQARLDAGASCVYLPAPKREYLISRTLLLGDGQELRLDRFTRIRLAPYSDCPMVGNRDRARGNVHLALTGGIWDFDNVHQTANFQMRQLDKPPQKEYPVGVPYDAWLYRGNAFYFENVTNMVVRGLTIRNPVTYALQFCRTSYFLVDDIEFDFPSVNPYKANMDGVHLDGGCHHGRISNIRGTVYDDMIAINANDGRCAAHEEAITDIDVDGVYCDYCHSAVRMLSTGAEVKRINIRNIHGNFYRYAVGFTHFFGNRPTRGIIDAVTVSDCHMAKCLQPSDMYRLEPFPIIYFDRRLDVGTVTIHDVTREERCSQEPTIGIEKGCRIARLIVRDCSQVNQTAKPLAFFRNRGEVREFVHENIRLVSASGGNMLFDGPAQPAIKP